MLIAAVVGAHLFFLERIGVSTPPFGLDDSRNRWRGDAFSYEEHPGGIPFFPNYLLQDLTSISLYFALFAAVVFFDPYLFFPKDAFIQANPFQTPAHIKPEWYFLANYQTLKLFPNEFIGLSVQGAAMTFLALLPFLDRGEEKHPLKRPLFMVCSIGGILLYSRADDMGALLMRTESHDPIQTCAHVLLLAFLPASSPSAPLPRRRTETVCIQCHGAQPGRLGEPVKLWRDSIHAENGISCNDCHGGDPKDLANAMSPARGFLGVPKDAAISRHSAAAATSASMKDYLAERPRPGPRQGRTDLRHLPRQPPGGQGDRSTSSTKRPAPSATASSGPRIIKEAMQPRPKG